MSTSGITVSSLFNNLIPGYQCTKLIQQNLQQLGNDLQSGNLSAAQSEASAFNILLPQLTSAAPAQSGNPLTQALNQLSQDLQAGNLSAAQQDYSTVQQYFQDAGIECPPSQPGGNGTMAGVLHLLFNQLSNAMNISGLISRPQILSIIQQGAPQFGPGAGSYSAQNLHQAGSNNLSLLA